MILADLGSRRVVVDIAFRSTKLKKECEDPARAQARWGAEVSRAVIRRLDQVRAATCLEDLSPQLPIRRHKLGGTRKGQYALNLPHGLRLVVQPMLQDGSPDLVSDPSRIFRVKVMEVTDYHD